VATWPDENGFIRVLEGPEHGRLRNPGDFFNQGFMVRNDSGNMGLRVEPLETPLVLTGNREMISEAVSDGTVQLTGSGPVILLRHRQTIGGYPRIFNVITADLDTLAQVGPMEIVRFRKVSMETAIRALKRKSADLEMIRESRAYHGG
jgi:allophanate hydrolase subunit 2